MYGYVCDSLCSVQVCVGFVVVVRDGLGEVGSLGGAT